MRTGQPFRPVYSTASTVTGHIPAIRPTVVTGPTQKSHGKNLVSDQAHSECRGNALNVRIGRLLDAIGNQAHGSVVGSTLLMPRDAPHRQGTLFARVRRFARSILVRQT